MVASFHLMVSKTDIEIEWQTARARSKSACPLNVLLATREYTPDWLLCNLFAFFQPETSSPEKAIPAARNHPFALHAPRET
jgi:hypothetical protein